MLVSAARPEEKARGEEIGGEGAGHLYLFVDGGHFGPTVEHVGHIVRVEDVEIFRAEEFGVADFDAVLPVGRKLSEKFIERGDEIAQALEVRRIERRKLEDEDAGLLAMRGERSEERVDKELGVEEVRVVGACAVAEAIQLGKFFHRDLVGHFEGQAESVRHLRAEVGEIFFRREPVVAGIDADGRKDFRVFFEALGLEAFGREFPACEVALLVVDLSKPTLVFPRGRAEVEVAVARQRVRGGGELFAREGHPRMITSAR